MVQRLDRQFIFPITTGRTGTTFVTHLLQLAPQVVKIFETP